MDLENKKLSSPYFPQNYFNDGIGCEWLITAPEGNIIFLEFDHFKENFLILFDGVCDQTKKLQTLSGSMDQDDKWIISSSGRYMFLRLIETTGFLAKILYGNEILNQKNTTKRQQF